MNVLQSEQQLAGGLVRLPRVNLLPAELVAGARLRRVQAGLACVVLASVAVVELLAHGAGSRVADAQGDVDAANADQAKVQRQVDGLRGVTQVYGQVTAAEAALTSAMGGEVRYSAMLDDLSQAVPSSVWLTSGTYKETAGAAASTGSAAPTAAPAVAPAVAPGVLAAAGQVGTLEMAGVALTHDDVAHWIDVLVQRKGLGRPVLRSQTEARIGEHVVVNFVLTVPVTQAALSQRYTKPGSRP